MINIRIHTTFNRIPIIAANIRPTASQVVRKTAFDVEAGVKKEMAEPKTGRIYRKGTFYSIKTRKALKTRTHQASAPGEAPAVDYGQLINSIQVENVTDLTSTVGTNIEYAMPLEFGSRRVKPRPVWRPVIEKMRKPFVEAMTFVLRQLR